MRIGKQRHMPVNIYRPLSCVQACNSCWFNPTRAYLFLYLFVIKQAVWDASGICRIENFNQPAPEVGFATCRFDNKRSVLLHLRCNGKYGAGEVSLYGRAGRRRSGNVAWLLRSKEHMPTHLHPFRGILCGKCKGIRHNE